MAQRECLFCNVGKPLTKEHVLPRWMHRSLNIRGPIKYESESGAERTSLNLDIQVRAVCKGCNEGWMHDLERAARAIFIPAFQRQPIVLNVGEQQVVSTWAVKTWLLAEYALARDRAGGLHSPVILHYLWQHRHPPPEMTVRIGTVNALRKRVATLRSTFVYAVDQEGPVGGLGILTIADLIFHLYCPVLKEGLPPHHLIPGPEQGPYLSKIWPHEVEEVRWPTTSILSLDSLPNLLPNRRIETGPF